MDKNSLIREITALKTIKQHVRLNRNSRVWRYATHIGEETDTLRFLPEGWYVQDI
jgi:hypothetical protein